MKIDLDKLKAPLDPKAITQHPTKSYLSSIKGIYVTERFNEVFGVGKWSIKVEKEYADYNTGMIVVKVTFEVKELGIYYESYGGNDNGGSNNKNFDLGDAYKGACTDAITKIGSYLGVAIDVYKGMNTNNSAKKNTPIDKPWLNPGTKRWERVSEKLKTGEIDIDEVKKYFNISKENQEKLLK